VFCIKCGSGKSLTVTPNHMLLTTRGIVTAKNMKKGDNILCCSDAKGMGFDSPDVNGSPSLIDDVFVTLLKSSSMSSLEMPVSAEHLHGDGRFCDGNINIVTPDGFLGHCLDPHVRQKIPQNDFVVRNPELLPFSGDSSLADILISAGLATNRLVSGNGSIFPDARRSSSHSERQAFTLSPNAYSSSDESFSDDGGRYSQFLSDVVIPESGMVSTDNIVDIEVSDYSGHIYDLLTKSTLYYANGYLSSNCVHYTVAVFQESKRGAALIEEQKGQPKPEVKQPEKRAKTSSKKAYAPPKTAKKV